MNRSLHSYSLIPKGLTVENVSADPKIVLITTRAVAATAACPLCGIVSLRVHSRYVRRVSDLPCPGRGVRLCLAARRFRCEEPGCPRRIFSERFGDDVLRTRSRCTARLDDIVHCLGLALGGRPGASFAKRLMLPVSSDTLLRTVRRRSRRPTEPLKVVGIDDWAVRRDHRYGSVVCDLERRRIVALLADREAATVTPCRVAQFASFRSPQLTPAAKTYLPKLDQLVKSAA